VKVAVGVPVARVTQPTMERNIDEKP